MLSLHGACRYERAERFENERQKRCRKEEANAAQLTEKAFQKWQVSPSNERCRWCCGLVVLLLIIFGPLFYFSTSAVIGQREPLLVKGARVQLDVRFKSNFTVNEYTLWSSSSATILPGLPVRDTFDSMGTELDKKNKSNIRSTLDKTYT